MWGCKLRCTVASAVLTALLASVPAAEAWAARPAHASAQIVVDGVHLFLEPEPVVVRGLVLVPARPFLEHLGLSVEYRAAGRQVVAAGRDRTVAFTLGRRSATVDGRLLALDAPPQRVEGRAFVPLRAVAQALGFGVRWATARRVAAVDTPAGDAASLPSLDAKDVRSIVVERVYTFEVRDRWELEAGDPSDRPLLERIVAAWNGAVPAFHPRMEPPAVPYGSRVTVGLRGGTLELSLAWERVPGRRELRDNALGFFYLHGADGGEPRLLYAPELHAVLSQHFPARGQKR